MVKTDGQSEGGRESAGEQVDDVFIQSDLGCVQLPTEGGTNDVTKA